MPKHLQSSLPPAASSSVPPNSRAKSLGPLCHADNVAPLVGATTAPRRDRKRNASPICDSANFRAARQLLRAREELGLSQEAVAVLTGVHPTTVGERERAEVDLGPMKQLVRLQEEAAKKGTSK